MSRRRVSEEERALWDGIARTVSPLRKAQAKAKPAALPVMIEVPPAPPRPVRKAAAPPPKLLPLVTLDRRTKQRVARGSEAIAERIDLHGMTQQEAHAALAAFLVRTQAGGAKVVLVITGKGGGDQARDGRERGVLRRQVPLWLALPEFRRFVVGFDEAHRSHGGQGALYVRLRRPR
jgi:DNA-nicking Smr family endonuclease